MRVSRAGIVMFALWAGAIGTGYAALNMNAGAPGIAAKAPAQFPSDAGFARSPGRSAVIMLAHPRCPCTRASLGELDRLMSRTGGHVDAFVVFSPTTPDDPTDLRKTAARIEGVRIIDDRSGTIAKRFGAATSGQVLVYGKEGDLAFAGGITAARGHEGDNGGAAAALEAALGKEKRTGLTLADVFGCELFGAEERR
jgi:hypothetical protein